MKPKRLIRPALFLTLIVSFISTAVFSETVVIVNPDIRVELSKETIRDIFLYNNNRLSDDSLMTPVNQSRSSIARKEFESRVINMDDGRLNRFWAEKIFSGNGAPPKEMDGDRSIKNLVAEHKEFIGYIEIKNVDDSVRVVHEIDVFTGR